MADSLIKDSHFHPLSLVAVLDKRKRVTLCAVGHPGDAFRVYQNSVGQILLDPVRAVPPSEAWLWQKPAALAAVKRGLLQVERGEVFNLGNFSDVP